VLCWLTFQTAFDVGNPGGYRAAVTLSSSIFSASPRQYSPSVFAFLAGGIFCRFIYGDYPE
jgi:hypothetical protein